MCGSNTAVICRMANILRHYKYSFHIRTFISIGIYSVSNLNKIIYKRESNTQHPPPFPFSLVAHRAHSEFARKNFRPWGEPAINIPYISHACSQVEHIAANTYSAAPTPLLEWIVRVITLFSADLFVLLSQYLQLFSFEKFSPIYPLYI